MNNLPLVNKLLTLVYKLNNLINRIKNKILYNIYKLSYKIFCKYDKRFDHKIHKLNISYKVNLNDVDTTFSKEFVTNVYKGNLMNEMLKEINKITNGKIICTKNKKIYTLHKNITILK